VELSIFISHISFALGYILGAPYQGEAVKAKKALFE